MEWLQRDKDTIAALATPPGEGGVGILRISGPEALSIAQGIFHPHRPEARWRSHGMLFGECRDAQGEMLDEVLAVWMAKGRSYTGEEVVELHGHGGQLNMLQLLRACLDGGARLAEPGEFTRRAFLHGRIDLTRAEAIADIICARNEQALRIARSHLQGRLKSHIDALADRSLMLAAQVESWIDFPEEFDPALDQAVARILEDIEGFTTEVRKVHASYQQGQRLQEGWSLLLLGRPNAGKSSLFNALSGQQRAIVTDVPGTTRDLLETQIALGGIQLQLTDSAGLRELEAQAEAEPSASPNPHQAIEKIGVDLALDAASRAHLLLAVFDLSRPFGEEDRKVLEACRQRKAVVILNKADLPRAFSDAELEAAGVEIAFRAEVSCETGEGIDALRSQIREYIEAQTPAGELLITNERQRDALAEALGCLEKAMEQGLELGPEFLAEDLRAARKALAAITGQISSEDILSAIFSRFCIGK